VKVVAEGLTKRFTVKGTPAVFGASFEAPSGGITTLLGPSGSGKTTILRIVAGLESADEGRILLDGEDITRTPIGRRRFGFVFQTFALFNQLSVRENIAFGLEAQGARGQGVGRRVDELLEMVQLGGLADRYPHQLSGGQRQRVGFARALAPHPRVLLLDEPFGALDARVRSELRAWLRELHQATHVTTLLVTHDQEEAMELSDRIVVMDKGRVHQVGSPREVYDDPRTGFVAFFVGAANVLKAEVKAGRAAVGSTSLAVRSEIPDGSNVRAIVRPHEVHVVRADDEPSANRAVGRIRRIARLGAYVKLDVAMPTDEIVAVHMPRAEFEQMMLVVGDPVLVDLDSARVFVEDFAI
jgi:sulfate transport system ATP-binding protein